MLPLPPTAFNAKDAVVANDALVAKLAVPNNEPVISGAISELVTVNPLVYLPEPDTSRVYIGLTTLIPTLPFTDPENGFPEVVE